MGSMPRQSAYVFLRSFIPLLIVAGLVVVAHQPHPNLARNHVMSWSGDIGIAGLVHDLAEYVSVLAFGIGLVFGYSFDTSGPATQRPAGRRRAVADETAAAGDETGYTRGRTADGTPVHRDHEPVRS